MASVFVNHVVGDLTVAKPELVEFEETETVESAIRAIAGSTENGIPVWRRKSQKANVIENGEMRQHRFVGILKSLHIVAFLARERRLEDHEKAMKTPVSEIVFENNSLLREVDSATRLLDVLEMMKQGVQRLLVPKGVPWRGVSNKFSVQENGKSTGSSSSSLSASSLSSSSITITPAQTKFCCLSREDVIRFVIGFLGALAPIPLTTISTLGAVNPHFYSIQASHPALEAASMNPQNPCAIAVVEPTVEGYDRIVGDISSCKLCKCDYLSAAYGLANLSAWQFVTGVEERLVLGSVDDAEAKSSAAGALIGAAPTRAGMFSSKSSGFFRNVVSQSAGNTRSMYQGRSEALTCKATSSLAAVMAQMLSHRSTHVWVTEGESDDILVGVISYADILYAMTIPPPVLLT